MATGDHTSRYIAAATRPLPARERADHAAELRASIRDQIDGRLGQGQDADAAEIAVLTDLGDPAVLAADYADRPLHLLGPRWYPTWRRMLRIVLWSALPFVAFAVALAMALEDRPFWGIVGPTIGVTLAVGAGIFTGMTLVYAALERAGEQAQPWNVEQLPGGDADQMSPVGRGEWIAGILAVGFAIAGLVVLTVPWDIDGPGRLSVLDPALWPWNLVVGVLLVLAGAFATLRARITGLWGRGSAIAGALLALAWAVPIVVLTVTGRLFDPAFVAYLDIDADAKTAIAGCLVAGAVAIAGWTVFAAVRRARRAG
ncbi:hypothetical protein [Microbacterium wangruii]|uniref:hypothetical protein n=1 Tax=Microbacterium wangruii TaxID=3049073 RepID=UPI00256EEB5D|nr:hypothetical protein [Microbacterium sp. zg-Y1211]MDL5485704.1 hypothetical protein [Microbacterium sp. zg-Y1211]